MISGILALLMIALPLREATMPKPTPSYPGSIAGDQQLAIAVNRFQTKLALPIGATDTQMLVTDASSIIPNMLLSLDIDGEIVQVIGPPASNAVTITRGFDGTKPVLHLAGATVSGLVDAYHHNTLAAEIEAIEQALGANLGNISSASVFLISTQFVFPPIAPGGSLLPGTNMITLAPVPKGISGTDTNHYLYISGGTGTAEAVLITGGTAVPGAASGTLFFTCANSHSGAWTIQSATAGIQEAACVIQTATPGHVAGGGEIRVPAGVQQIYGTITLFEYTTLRGAGSRTTVLQQNIANVSLITMPTAYSWGVHITDLCLLDTVSTTAGALIDTNNVHDWSVENCFLQGGYYGIHIQNNTLIFFSNINFTGQQYASVLIDGAESGDMHWNHVEVIGSVPNNYIIKSAGGLYFNDVGSYGGGYGMQIVPGAGQHVGDLFFVNCGFDSGSNYGLTIEPKTSDAYVTRVMLVNAWSATNEFGVWIDATVGTVRGVEWIGGRVINNTSGGVNLVGNVKEVIFSSVVIGGNSTASNGGAPGFAVNAGVAEVKLLDCRIGQPYDWYGGNPFTNQHSASVVLYAGASDYIEIIGNRLVGDVAPLFNGSTGTHNVIRDNVGYNPAGLTGISVGPSPFTYTAGASPEEVYIYGGAVSSIARSGTAVANGVPAHVSLPPNGALTVTYSATPVMLKDVK